MRRLGLTKTKLLVTFVFSGIFFTWFLLGVPSPNRQYVVQDATFMTGLFFLMVTGFHVSAASGLFDIVTYGYGLLKKAGDRKSYKEYLSERRHAVKYEPMVVGLFYLVCSLVMRLAS